MFPCSIKTGRWGSVSQRYNSSSFTFFLWFIAVGVHSVGLRPRHCFPATVILWMFETSSQPNDTSVIDWARNELSVYRLLADVCTYSVLCYFRDMRGILEEWRFLWKVGYLQTSGRRVSFFSAMVMVILLHFSLKVRTGLLCSPHKAVGINHKITLILFV